MNRIHRQPMLLFVALCIGVLAAGCFGGGGNGGTDVPLTLNITVEPTSVQIGGEVTLVAKVEGSGADDATVTWAADAGSFNLNEGKEVIWTSPDEPGKYTITATAAGVGEPVIDRVEVTVEGADDGGDPGDDPEHLTVEITTDGETVAVGETVALTATVTGTRADEADVAWSSSGGTLSPRTGKEVTWTAPDEAGEYTITATAGADDEIVSEDVLITVEPLAQDLCGTGDATDESDPRIVCTVEELQDIKAHLDGHFALGQHIDAYETEQWNDGAGFEPIGTRRNEWTSPPADPPVEEPFRGTLDGRGFEIRGLHINRSEHDHIGLFGYVEDAVIRNIGLAGGAIAGRFSVGGLVGLAAGVEIHKSYNENDVQGSVHTGGLVGEVIDGRFSMTHSHNTGHIKVLGEKGGGLVGGGYAGAGVELLIEHSYNEGDVEGPKQVGGLAGNVLAVAVRHSYNTGEIVGTRGADGRALEIGGLIGLMNGGLVEFSYNDGPVGPAQDVDARSVGGLVGREWGDNALVVDSHNTGIVRGTMRVGGVVGDVDGAVIERVHNEGDVTGLRRAGNAPRRIGGVVGRLGGLLISNSYNTGDVVAAGGSAVGGVVGALDFGKDQDVVRQSFNTGKVSGENAVGGVAGFVTQGALVEDSYNLGPVSGGLEVGGLVGVHGIDFNPCCDTARINNSYNAGSVSGGQAGGGLVGVLRNTEYVDVKSSYYDTEASGVEWSAGGEGRSTADMKKRATFAGWDFDTIWTIDEGTDYPDLLEAPRP